MSFREPLLLAGLLIVPLALLAYWAAQRRRRRYAIRYPALDVLAGVDADRVLDDVLEHVPVPRIELAEEGTRSR